MLCSCRTGERLLTLMGRTFHKCSCSGALADGTGPSCATRGFLERKGPLRDNRSTDVLSEACFLNYFTSNEAPTGAWGGWKQKPAMRLSIAQPRHHHCLMNY